MISSSDPGSAPLAENSIVELVRDHADRHAGTIKAGASGTIVGRPSPDIYLVEFDHPPCVTSVSATALALVAEPSLVVFLRSPRPGN